MTAVPANKLRVLGHFSRCLYACEHGPIQRHVLGQTRHGALEVRAPGGCTFGSVVLFGCGVEGEEKKCGVWVCGAGFEEGREEGQTGSGAEVAAVADVGDLGKKVESDWVAWGVGFTYLDSIEFLVGKVVS
jgi:hypothetical protein